MLAAVAAGFSALACGAAAAQHCAPGVWWHDAGSLAVQGPSETT
jgi:hypothetical protein